MKRLTALFLCSLILLGTAGIAPVHAADFRTGEEVIISEGTQNLEDLYLFGGNIRVNAPVANDTVAAGGDITINQNVTGSVMVAGGNINLSGTVGNTVRAAGGNIRIDGPVTRDLVVAGGSVTITKNATIGRDLILSGGNLVLEGPVKGKVVVNGGNATLNSTIGGNVEGTIEKLTLGPSARINGSLTYKSEEKVQMASGAVVQGKTSYTPIEREEKREDKAQEFLTAGSIYKLVTDIVISILLISFFARALMTILTRMAEKTVESGAIGFAFVLIFPLVALILFLLIWLGVASWLSYALILLVSLYIVKIFLGWLVMRWWEKRNNKEYRLDWKAGILGPILLFIIFLIPILGWIAAAILFFVATGAVLHGLVRLMSGQKLLPQKAVAKKK